MTSSARGLLVVDKPVGPTSHDVVGKLRRLFQTKRVGHAGTLDPMATGVLVALVGEATKLSSWLTLDDKAYVARVAFGRATDTLDATGRTTQEADVPAWLRDEVRAFAAGETSRAPRVAAALEAERARTSQVPPDFSAIQKGGVRAHAAARAGRSLDLDARHVEVRALHALPPVAGGDETSLQVELDVGKGYYVRSFARDLGVALGVPACLSSLRRIRSGPFTIEAATTLEALAQLSPSEREAKLLALRDVARAALPCVALTDEGLRKARLGQRLEGGHFATEPPAEGAFAWLDGEGELVSIGQRSDESYAVTRNMVGAEMKEDVG